MQSASFPARQARSHYRHELRTLTYVTLDEANGGIIRNVSHEGVAVQAVAAPRTQQRLRLRFELRFPRLKVEAYGQVSWTGPSGQCGIRFVDLPPRVKYQINQWMFAQLLDAAAREASQSGSIFGAQVIPIARHGYPSQETDGLTLSATPRPAIRLEPELSRREGPRLSHLQVQASDPEAGLAVEQLGWLYRPVSARTLARFVDILVVISALLLFALIFLSITHELPQWPLTLGAVVVAAAFVATAYWSVFAVFGGQSLGARLVGVGSGTEKTDERDGTDRFR